MKEFKWMYALFIIFFCKFFTDTDIPLVEFVPFLIHFCFAIFYSQPSATMMSRML